MAEKSILYIITKSVWGGAAKYVFDLATHLPKNEFKFFVAAGSRNKLAQKIIEADIPYFEIKNFQRDINPFKEIFAFFEVLKLIYRLKPDIVHVNSSKAGGIVGLAGWAYRIIAGKKIRLIFTAHGWAFNEARPKWQIRIIKTLSKITSFFYDKIICVSEYDRRAALDNKIAPTEKLKTIYNGINFEKISFLSRQEAQEKLIGKSSSLLIGTIAEWTKNKGLFYLLKAVKQIQGQGIKFDLVLIGSGENPDKEKIYNFIKKNQLKNIYCHQWVDQAARCFKALDIFILPSVKEGLPYTILEAMAAEVPIIATSVGGVPEMISRTYIKTPRPRQRSSYQKGMPLKVQNDCGILIPPKNSQQLAEKIIYLINNPLIGQSLAQKAKQKLIKEFSLEKMISQTKNLY